MYRCVRMLGPAFFAVDAAKAAGSPPAPGRRDGVEVSDLPGHERSACDAHRGTDMQAGQKPGASDSADATRTDPGCAGAAGLLGLQTGACAVAPAGFSGVDSAVDDLARLRRRRCVMRRYVSLFLLALLACVLPEDGASVRGRARIESVGPDSGVLEVIEAPYAGGIEGGPESATREEDEQLDRWFARESVVVINGEVIDHEEIAVRRRAARREAARNDLPGRLSRAISEQIRGVKVLAFKLRVWVEGVRCDDKRFMSPPPAPAGHCPDGAEDCDDASLR